MLSAEKCKSFPELAVKSSTMIVSAITLKDWERGTQRLPIMADTSSTPPEPGANKTDLLLAGWDSFAPTPGPKRPLRLEFPPEWSPECVSLAGDNASTSRPSETEPEPRAHREPVDDAQARNRVEVSPGATPRWVAGCTAALVMLGIAGVKALVATGGNTDLPAVELAQREALPAPRLAEPAAPAPQSERMPTLAKAELTTPATKTPTSTSPGTAAASGAQFEVHAQSTAPSELRVVAGQESGLLAVLRQRVSFSGDELAETLDESEASVADFIRGDLSSRDSIRRKGRAYTRHCRLAERLTLLQSTFSTPATTATQRRAETLLLQLARNADNRDNLSHIALLWLQHGKRKTTGIVLAGKVVGVTQTGETSEYAVELQGRDQRRLAPVLITGGSFSVGDDVAVVGVIVEEPRERLLGYLGSAREVIVASLAVDLAPPSTAPVDAHAGI